MTFRGDLSSSDKKDEIGEPKSVLRPAKWHFHAIMTFRGDLNSSGKKGEIGAPKSVLSPEMWHFHEIYDVSWRFQHFWQER
ncbi:MAG: hypothetical protein VXX80_10690 [Bacteroidota bacterium]|nr:hypothetical protein [Bacteroidota bacterium]